MKFKIQITEMLQRLVEVDAETAEDAEMIVRKQYRSERIVLNSSDFVSVEFGAVASQNDVGA